MKLSNIFNKYILYSVLISMLDLVYGDGQVLQIYSQCQVINTLTNTIFFKEDVVLVYKKIKLYANEIVILIHSQNPRHVLMIKAYGDPVILHHDLESDCSISAQSSMIQYNAVDNIIKFIGNVRIEQLGSFIQSDNITYFVDQKKVQAISKENNKTIIVLRINPI